MEARFPAVIVAAEPIGRFALIGDHVARVIRNGVEDHGESLVLRGIDQGTQLVVSLARIVSEPGLGAEEVVDSIAVIGRLKSEVPEDGAESEAHRP